MSVWIYKGQECVWLWQVVLFDGENTYWTDEMQASPGYTLNGMNTCGAFEYVCEL
jgi:hypothetical protein